MLLIACCVAAHAAGSVTMTPVSHDFHNVYVGLKTDAFDFDVVNGGSTTVTVSSFRVNSPAFLITQGIAPVTLTPGTSTHYTVVFKPTAAQVYSGSFQVRLNTGATLTSTLTGTGLITTAKTSLSSTTLDFGAVTQGQVVTKKTVTITNTGSESVRVLSAVTQPPFTVSVTGSSTIAAGASLPLTVSFYPGLTGLAQKLVVIEYDSLPPQAVSITGNVSAASTLAVSIFPRLPGATQGASYSSTLTAAGGKAPYTWSLVTSGTLPTGLTLASNGVISGTVASSTRTGTFNFTSKVSDSSSPPVTATKQMMITVGAPTGANCNNISWNVPNTSTLITPLDVLGTGTYQGSEGGLYANGSNIRPADHTSFGIGLAQGIQPLDSNGNPDPNGKEVIVVLGESNVHTEGDGFEVDGTADPLRNPAVVIVNAGIGNGTASQLSIKTSPFWDTILNYIIPNYGVTPAQVVAVWAEPTDELKTGSFPSDIGPLLSHIEGEARNMTAYFPNVKLAYFSSRIYGGYSNGLKETNPEPYAYEDGFAVKMAIQAQLDGDPTLNFDPSKGPVMAPWMSWGPYTWANGLVIPNSNGSVWSCQDIRSDGTHPTNTT
ncbi:MAG: choice-of-anchor D domain-containing protein, partial [Acidobacteriales bacterium]|nr:choice-of-anchor D domain-containing protein [Terriglobales bacterium]